METRCEFSENSVVWTLVLTKSWSSSIEYSSLSLQWKLLGMFKFSGLRELIVRLALGLLLILVRILDLLKVVCCILQLSKELLSVGTFLVRVA